MPTILRRAVLPLLSIIAGVAALVYGVRFHVLPVIEERESEITVNVPEPFSPMQPSFPGMDPQAGPPQFRKQTATKITEEILPLAEPALIRDATIGGIVLSEARELKRTYRGAPPLLCPT
ncbi:MAG: hypothetical protein IT426_08655 [Pirellulales bacterium]|nr:hypothetical protein [Pirellulales bacterium]